MFKFSRAYQHTAAFLARQGGFDFAVVTDAVLAIITAGKRKAWTWYEKWRKGFRTPPAIHIPHQLVLELDAIAQIPLAFPKP